MAVNEKNDQGNLYVYQVKQNEGDFRSRLLALSLTLRFRAEQSFLWASDEPLGKHSVGTEITLSF